MKGRAAVAVAWILIATPATAAQFTLDVRKGPTVLATAATVVPEPEAIALVAIAVVAVLVRQIRRLRRVRPARPE